MTQVLMVYGAKGYREIVLPKDLGKYIIDLQEFIGTHCRIELSLKNGIWHFGRTKNGCLRLLVDGKEQVLLDGQIWEYRRRNSGSLILWYRESEYKEKKKRIYKIKGEEKISFGKSLVSQICYQGPSMVSREQGEFTWNGRKGDIKLTGANALFLNGVPWKGRRELWLGDRLEWYGVEIAFLSDGIAVSSWFLEQVSTGAKLEEMREKVSSWQLCQGRDVFGVEAWKKESIQEKWMSNDVGKEMKVPVGVDEYGEVYYLDLHEKSQGPHGLVSGTTGGGKTIFLQTLLLGLAISYSPKQLQFLLIDYKGGGMANKLKALPHVAGVLTNLEKSDLERGLQAIRSEIRRREQLLTRLQASHIEEYNQLIGEEHEDYLPHLLIVIDEFAELKGEVEDWLDGVSSIARVGRSLGLQLLLATQKPGGVVDPSIWTNCRCRVCFAVQEEIDSKEMIGITDATKLENPGRCFVRAGNSIKEIQTSWFGEKDERGRSQVELLLACIEETVKLYGWKSATPLWQPLLPEDLQSEVLCQEHEVCMGWYDDPQRQEQGIVKMSMRDDHNLAILGNTKSGKTTGVKTLLVDSFRKRKQEELQCYIMDFDGGLEEISAFSQVKAYANDSQNAHKLLYRLKKELARRKEKQSKGSQLICVLDNMAQFRRETKDYWMDDLYEVIEAGPTYGIHTVITARDFGTKEIPVLWRGIMKKLLLQPEDKQVQRVFNGKEYAGARKQVPGRGLLEYKEHLVQIQIARFTKEEIIRIRYEKDDFARSERMYFLPEKFTIHDFWSRELTQRGNDKNGVIGCEELSGEWITRPTNMQKLILVGNSSQQIKEILQSMVAMQKGRNEFKIEQLQEKQKEMWLSKLKKAEKDLACNQDEVWILVEQTKVFLEECAEQEELRNVVFQLEEEYRERIVWCLACKENEYRSLRRIDIFGKWKEEAGVLYMGEALLEQSFVEVNDPACWEEEYMKKREVGCFFGKEERCLIRLPIVEEQRSKDDECICNLQ